MGVLGLIPYLNLSFLNLESKTRVSFESELELTDLISALWSTYYLLTLTFCVLPITLAGRISLILGDQCVDSFSPLKFL